MCKEKDFNIGILCFNEQLGMDLIKKLNNLKSVTDIDGQTWNIKAEHIYIHEINMGYKTKYKVILDRRSHVLKQAVGVLMYFAYAGVHIINNPMSFYYFISNKDCGFSMMNDLGINIPSTYVLPPYITPIISPEDFKYHLPVNWEKIEGDIGFPCYIKPCAGRGAINVNKANNMDELKNYYSQSGELIMTVQKAISTADNWQVRCLCVGKKIIPIKYIFKSNDQSEYIFEENFLSSATGKIIMDSTMIINRAFGYEMNSVEFIIDDKGIPWAIDFNNPVPDGRLKVLGEIYYKDYLEALEKHIIYIAKYHPSYTFLPELNIYSEIAREDITKEEKFQKALEAAKKYYTEDQ